jgi:DNA mismatch repair protein MutS
MTKKAQLTPMLQQFLDIKKKHADKLILFRMGDFFETFFDDAKQAAKLLGITLTSRDKKAEDPVPMAGFPYHALDSYLEKLVKNGIKVVICEQMEDPKQAKGIVKREIVDIITPGSIIDGKYINASDNNYLAAVAADEDFTTAGLAFIDVSTGEFKYTQLRFDELTQELYRNMPKEIITISSELEKKLNKTSFDYLPTISNYDIPFFDQEEAENQLKEHYSVTSLEGFGANENDVGIYAAGLALSYVHSLKQESLKYLLPLRFYSLDTVMHLDEVSRKNLELTKSIRYNSRYGSLISVLDTTNTPMGARKLQTWLLNPLLDKNEIEERHNAVDSFKASIAFTEDLRKILSDISDISRIISKIGTKRINPREMNALKNNLKFAPQITNILSEFDNQYIAELKNRIKDYSEITNLISTAIVDNPPIIITEGGVIKKGYSDYLDELRQISTSGKAWIARMEESERKRTGIPSLKVGYNKVFGYYIEVTKTHKDKIPDYYIRKQTLVNAERFISPQLKEYESKVLGAEDRIKSLEYEIFSKVRDRLHKKIPLIQEYAETIATLDVLSTFGHVAYKNNYCKPVINDDEVINIKHSRHPVIEALLQDEKFIPNDVYLNDKDCKIALITGPNMAGKSTYLRQIGLIIIMAQCGSFVPAESAELPITDKVFTRVGASDNLAMGQSTFLVEMLETANILNSATPRSLILLDEIGRGTSTFDGLSLAWAIVEHIHNNPKISAKTLFATHYHELTELENILPGVKNYNITVKEWKNKIIFIRKIERGSADQSYGIHVAQLAGVPQTVIDRAKQILRNLEEHELSPQGLTAKAKKQILSDPSQLDIFDAIYAKTEEKNAILEEIKELDIENLTPLQAIQKLSELQKKI